MQFTHIDMPKAPPIRQIHTTMSTFDAAHPKVTFLCSYWKHTTVQGVHQHTLCAPTETAPRKSMFCFDCNQSSSNATRCPRRSAPCVANRSTIGQRATTTSTAASRNWNRSSVTDVNAPLPPSRTWHSTRSPTWNGVSHARIATRPTNIGVILIFTDAASTKRRRRLAKKRSGVASARSSFHRSKRWSGTEKATQTMDCGRSSVISASCLFASKAT